MALLPILTVPDPLLRRVCVPVTAFDARLRQLEADMFETMYAAPGVGLAAPQVGVAERMLVVDVSSRDAGEGAQPYCLVNPVIVWQSEALRPYNEGCLSLPEQFSEVIRPSEIRVKYQTVTGEEKEVHATGLLATCIQHEMDHLEGTLFVDHISRIKRDMILRRLAKLQRSGE